MADGRLRVVSETVRNLEVRALLNMPFIDKFIRNPFPSETEIVLLNSPSVLILMVQKMEANNIKEQEEVVIAKIIAE